MRWIALHFLFIGFFLGIALAQDTLDEHDIKKVIEELLTKQGKKELNPEIVKKSLTNFINEFDPKKVYLLEKESSPYESLTDAEAKVLEHAYREGNFEVYEKLAVLFQQSIQRARKIREKVFAADDFSLPLEPTNSYATFASSEEDLKKRWRDLLSYRFENKNPSEWPKIKEKTEKDWRDRESDWLSTDEFGKPLPSKIINTRFVLHVLKALAKGIDAHTSIYNPKEAEDMRMRLEKETIGIGVGVVKSKNDALEIRQIVKGGPAEKTHLLQIGDEIIQINDKKVEVTSLDEILRTLRGDKPGEEIQMVIRRPKEENRLLKFKLKTEEMPIQEGRVEITKEPYLDGYIGRIVLHAFYQGTGDVSSELDTKKAIQELENGGKLYGLVLDLRDNSGGFLLQAVKTAGLFITNGIVVISRYFNGDQQYYRDLDGKVAYKGPFVILVSRLTASAAEIVAQSLQDYGVAIVVGDEQTYGKGTIQTQNVTDKTKNTFFKVTVGKYYTVSGKTPQMEGVRPDIVIPGPYSNQRIGEAFLQNPLPSDKIPPNFQDSLKDVGPASKPWFLRYYLPRLQARGDIWQKMVPKLREDSFARQRENFRYKALLSIPPKERTTADERMLLDFQLQEAYNVIKDMAKICEENHCSLIPTNQ